VSFITSPFTVNTALFAVIVTGRTPFTAIWLIALAGLIISVTRWAFHCLLPFLEARRVRRTRMSRIGGIEGKMRATNERRKPDDKRA